MRITARSVSSDLIGLIKGEAVKGAVHSLFAHACNIMLEDGRIVALTIPPLANYPSSVKLDMEEGSRLGDFGIKAGIQIALQDRRIDFGGISAFIDLAKAGIWDASLVLAEPQISRGQLKKHLEEVKSLVLSSGNRDGLASVLDERNSSSIVNFIMPTLERLAAALKRQDYALVRETARGLVGFGPGLTPSADDFLLGVMASLYCIGNFCGWSPAAVRLLTSAMVSDIEGRTTTVSEMMLRNGAKGLYHEPLRDLMLAVTSNMGVKKKCMELLKIGGSSGSDCASGVVYCGMIILETDVMKEAQQCL